MASNRPAYGDPFADRPRQTHFVEPTRPQPGPYGSEATLPRFESSTSIPQGSSHYDEDDEYAEKQPLTKGENFTGGFYPPE